MGIELGEDKREISRSPDRRIDVPNYICAYAVQVGRYVLRKVRPSTQITLEPVVIALQFLE